MIFKYRCLLIIAPLILVLDQLTKWLVRTHIPFRSVLPVIPGYVDLVHVMNTGAAFGIFSGPTAGWRTPFFIIISICALAAIGYILVRVKPHERLLPVILSLVVGGIFGNGVDRIRFGAVTDYLSVHWRDVVIDQTFAGWHVRVPLEWPAFNVADSAITVSMILLAWQVIRKK